MDKRISKKEIVNIASQISMEPSEEFIAEMRSEYENNPTVITDGRIERPMWMKTCIVGLAVVVLALITVGTVWTLKKDGNKAYADTYSFEEYHYDANAAGMSAQFADNQAKSNEMFNNFINNNSIDTESSTFNSYVVNYAIDSISAAGYPVYYGGRYINVDGKLIVLIKETYYKRNFRKCDWYDELVWMLGSEDFSCRPVKYSYAELLTGMDELVDGELAEKLKEAGIRSAGDDITCEIVWYGLNDYDNCIEIGIRREEDAERIKAVLPGDMFRMVVVGDEEVLLY